MDTAALDVKTQPVNVRHHIRKEGKRERRRARKG